MPARLIQFRYSVLTVAGAPHPVDRSKLQVVLEVFAHSWQIDGHRHLMLGKQPSRAQTRDLHQMRRANSSGAQDHLPAGSDVDDLAIFEQPQAGDALLRRGPGTATLILVDLVVHQEPQGLGLRVDGEIRSVGDGMQEGIGHRPATATPLVDMKVRTAGVVRPG